MNSIVRENIIVALRAIRGQLLRTIITVFIIALGITALVGILTAIDGIKHSISSTFNNMGANTFTIKNRGMGIRIGKGGKKPKKYRYISYDEAVRFKNRYKFPGLTSISIGATQIATVKYGSKKSNPNIAVNGGDENYLLTSGYELAAGRNFSTIELQKGYNVVILGSELWMTLFEPGENPIGAEVSIGSHKYTVIGVLKSKGSSMAFGGDKNCIVPVENVRHYFSTAGDSYLISVMTYDAQSLDAAVGEATGAFRVVRSLKVGEEDNFEIMKSDNLSTILIDNIKYVTIAATIIGIITLFGAAIGLMNIMLVSVTERTREIGVRKALGATVKLIRQQFLIEAVVICQLGGLFGIILGILAGNGVSMLVGGGFIIPWLWMGMGILVCVIVGIISGIYPAIKASELDPIEALRYE